MKRQIALLILAFAVLMFSVQGRENPNLGPMAVKTEHSQTAILLEGSGLIALESITKSYISDEDDEDNSDNSDALEVSKRSKRGR
jgi:hypothetical protein